MVPHPVCLILALILTLTRAFTFTLILILTITLTFSLTYSLTVSLTFVARRSCARAASEHIWELARAQAQVAGVTGDRADDGE